MYAINTNTYIITGLFATTYLIYIARKTARQQLDLYDFVMLSTVAVVPLIFVCQPGLAHWLADLAGVTFPFVIMFGVLFLILFLFVHHIIEKMHQLDHDNRILIQEVGLLRMELGPHATESGREQDAD